MILINFDVIAKPASSLGERQPDSEGRYIWNMFHQQEMGRIMIISNQEYDRKLFETWLKREAFKAAMYDFVDFPDPYLRAERIHTIAAMFGKVKWYVDTDPRVATETLKLGMPTLLVAKPLIIRPEWHGEKEIKPWDTLIQELDDQALKTSIKKWGDID